MYISIYIYIYHFQTFYGSKAKSEPQVMFAMIFAERRCRHKTFARTFAKGFAQTFAKEFADLRDGLKELPSKQNIYKWGWAICHKHIYMCIYIYI